MLHKGYSYGKLCSFFLMARRIVVEKTMTTSTVWCFCLDSRKTQVKRFVSFDPLQSLHHQRKRQRNEARQAVPLASGKHFRPHRALGSISHMYRTSVLDGEIWEWGHKAVGALAHSPWNPSWAPSAGPGPLLSALGIPHCLLPQHQVLAPPIGIDTWNLM